MPKRDTNMCLLRAAGAMEKQHPLKQFAIGGFTTLLLKWATDNTYIYVVKNKEEKMINELELCALV